MNKIIQFFLITEGDQAKNDFLSLSDFIIQENERFEHLYNISVDLLTIEDYDIPQWKMEEYKEQMKECEAVFFLIFTELSATVRECFDIVWKKFTDNGKPSIYTYFFGYDDIERNESVKAFMSHLDKQLGHYYSRYENIDTIKLQLQHILNIYGDNKKIKMTFSDGYLNIDGKKVMSLENIPLYSSNDQLNRLKKELEEINKEYFSMKAVFTEKQDDSAFFREYAEIAAKRQNILDSIKESEKYLFDLSMKLTKDSAHGEMTPRQREAYHYFEMGMSEKAIAILDTEEMNADFDRQMQADEERIRKRATIHIKEHYTKIIILETMTGYKERFDEIISSYERITSTALRYHVEYDLVFQYVKFLCSHRDFQKAYTIGKELEEVYLRENQPLKEQSELWSIFCIITANIPEKHDETEKYLLRRYEAEEQLLSENHDQFSLNYIMSCNNLGSWLFRNNQYEKADELYQKAINMCQKRERRTYSRNSQGNVLSSDDLSDCEKMYLQILFNATNGRLRAIETEKGVLNIDTDISEEFSAVFAVTYLLSGELHYTLKQSDIAAAYLEKALNKFEQLINQHASLSLGLSLNSHMYYYGRTCNLLGKLYSDIRDFNKAEGYFLKGLETNKQLAIKMPEEFWAYYEESYNNIISYFGIFDKSFDEKQEQIMVDYATDCNKTGDFFHKMNLPQKAERYYLKALEISRQLSRNNAKKYLCVYANGCNKIGDFYNNKTDFEKAEHYYTLAIGLEEVLVRNNPEAFFDKYANSCIRMLFYFEKRNCIRKGELYCLKALEMRDLLSADNPKRFTPELAFCSFFYGRLHKSDQHLDLALEIARMHPDEKYCREIIKEFTE